jgi:hypothetical protein
VAGQNGFRALETDKMNAIICIMISAVILFGMAKKTENKWRQLSLLAAGKAAVNLQRAGEDVIPAEMYFGHAICLSEQYDLNRLLMKTSDNGWITDTAEVLIIEDHRPSKTALMITSRPLIRFFTGLAADAIDNGAKTEDKKVVGDGFSGVVDYVELDGGEMDLFELHKGKEKYSPYFVIAIDQKTGKAVEDV